jgi:hypothetical protein
MITAGAARRPVLLPLLRTGAEIIGVEIVKATAAQVESAHGERCGEEPGAELSEDETDQRRGETMRELTFFIGRA